MDTSLPMTVGTYLTPDQMAAFYIPVGRMSLADLASAYDEPINKELYDLFASDAPISVLDAKVAVQKRIAVSLWSHVKVHKTTFTERQVFIDKLRKRVLGGDSAVYTMVHGGMLPVDKPVPFDEMASNFVEPCKPLLLYKPSMGHQICAPQVILPRPEPEPEPEPEPQQVVEPQPRLVDSFFSSLLPADAVMPNPLPVGPAATLESQFIQKIRIIPPTPPVTPDTPAPVKRSRKYRPEVPTEPVSTRDEFLKRKAIGDAKARPAKPPSIHSQEFQKRKAAARAANLAKEEARRLRRTAAQEARLSQIALVLAQRAHLRRVALNAQNVAMYWASCAKHFVFHPPQ